MQYNNLELPVVADWVIFTAWLVLMVAVVLVLNFGRKGK